VSDVLREEASQRLIRLYESWGKPELAAPWRDRLEQGVLKLIPQAQLNGHPDRRLPNILNLTVPGLLRGES
jgi:cysteine sulfinate desulfinase/cysteine desulfurase-like protein